MMDNEPIIAPPKQIISPALKQMLNLQEQKYTVVHCSFSAGNSHAFIRIWPSTFLIDTEGNEYKLLQMDNIVTPPKYVLIPVGTTHHFTLFFEGLSKACTTFNFIELINESGAFFVPGIQRNKTDVYRIDLSNAHL